jgi:tRNA A58 N-methylase Trm61
MTDCNATRRTLVLLLTTLLVPPTAFAQRSAAGISSGVIFEAIAVKEGATVCEVGAGDGELTIAAAHIVGPTGRVLSSELGEQRIKALQEKTAAANLAQISVVPGDTAKTNFPEGTCEGLFLRDVYHHLTDPAAMNASIFASLEPGARVAVVDFTPPGAEAECPADRSKDGMHGVYAETVIRELRSAGFESPELGAKGHRWFMVVASKR